MGRAMSGLRSLFRDHRCLALLVLAPAFCLRALVPAGHMIVSAGPMVLTVSICADSTGEMMTREIVVPGKGGKLDKADKDTSCAFSSLAKALGGADPILLALAFAFLLVFGLAPMRALPTGPAPFTLPPTRGPPARA